MAETMDEPNEVTRSIWKVDKDGNRQIQGYMKREANPESSPSPATAEVMPRVDTLGANVDGDVRIDIAAWDYGLVGAARIEAIFTERPRLVDVYVHHTRRREGIGEALTKAAMEWARGRDKPLYLYVRPDNTAARSLYEKLGWTYVEQDDEGDLWMQAPRIPQRLNR